MGLGCMTGSPAGAVQLRVGSLQAEAGWRTAARGSVLRCHPQYATARASPVCHIRYFKAACYVHRLLLTVQQAVYQTATAVPCWEACNLWQLPACFFQLGALWSPGWQVTAGQLLSEAMS